MARLPVRGVRHIQRYREIAGVLIHHGFGELIDALDLQATLSLPQRLLGREGEEVASLSMPERLRLAMEELGPTFIKLGQVLSTRPDLLPAPFVAELTKLQDTVPPEPWEPIERVLEEELGAPVEEVFASFETTPLAAASLSQVHAATLSDGAEVVLKVQRPDIQRTIETDLEILFDIARLLQERTPLGELYDLPGIAREFATTLRAELDFFREGHNADRFRANFSDEPFLHVPHIYWTYTTSRLLVMERIRGIKIDNVERLDAAGYDRSRIAEHAARMVIKEVLEDGFFHADPHPGNFVVMPGEVIGAMDFGMFGHLSRQAQVDLIRLYVVIIQMDVEGIADQLIRMGAVKGSLDRTRLQQDLGRLLRKYHGMPIQAIQANEVIEEAMPIAFRHHLHLPTNLWLLAKTLAMLEGVALKLDPDFNIVTFSEPYIRRFVWRLASPSTWGPGLLRGTADWADLLGTLPRVGLQLLRDVEKDGLEFTLSHQGLEETLVRLDRLANRLSLSMLLAALIVGLALVIPVLNLPEQWGVTEVLVVVGFVGVSILGLGLAFSIWRSGR